MLLRFLRAAANPKRDGAHSADETGELPCSRCIMLLGEHECWDSLPSLCCSVPGRPLTNLSESGNVPLRRPRQLRPYSREMGPMAKSESTSKKVAASAAKVMKSKTASKAEKSVAASALTQTKSKKETTGKAVAASASKIMRDPKSSKAAKSAAASALTQKTKKK